MKQTQQKPKKEIYLLLGENEIEKEEYIEKLISTFSKDKNVQIINIDLETDDDKGLKTFVEHCTSSSLFGEKKIVILKANKSLTKTEREMIISGISNVGEDTLVIITSNLSPYKFDKNISLAIENKGGEVKTFWKVFESSLPEYVKNLLLKNQIEPSEELIKFLIERNGNDPNGLYEDINYVRNYFQTSGMIKAKDAMEALFLKSGEGDIFMLVSAIIKKEKHRALLILNDIIEKGENIYALGLLIYRQVEKIINVKKLSEKFSTDEEIAKQLEISTFEVKNIKKLLKDIDETTLKKLIKLSLLLEKNIRNSTNIKNILLEKVIIETL
jgi:DNA polymerase-3 subunit delta